nr:MAG: ORF1 [Torque teno midi virus]
MPFWWRRRRRPWYGRYRYKTRRRYTNKRRRRRRISRRRNRKYSRRRRRRRFKVRRKLKKIHIQQWQPESITKCKIVGFSDLVLGAEGNQYLCWTTQAKDYTQPKAPGGGGFGSELITLEWLYSEYKAHNNIWTKSNKNKDLVRYTGGIITLFRHPTTDFIFHYSLQAPFDLTKFTYSDMQPQNMLLRPKKRIILSQKNKPFGKKTVKIKLKPPKQMSTKWFFQPQFAEAGLVLLQASAANFQFSRIGPKAQNQMVTLYYLDIQFWQTCNWAATQDKAYKPIATKNNYKFKYKLKGQTTEQELTMNMSDASWQGQAGYNKSIHRDTGWWQKAILNSTSVEIDSQQYANKVIYTARYNPNEDTGEGNYVYAVSLLQSQYTPPRYQTDYVITGQPLWMAFYGFYSYLQQITKDKAFDIHYMFVVQSKAIHPITVSTQTIYPFIDWDFINGTLPWEEYLSDSIKKLWYPQARFQQVTINSIVEAGPFVPKYNNLTDSTWELPYKYKFYFKWGGPQVHDEPVDDPQGKHEYPVPDTMHQTIQIGNPKKQTPESILHQWDYRRGIITQAALKRMSENIQTDTSFESDESETPKKKRKVTKEMPLPQEKEEKLHKCLLSLYEENTCQQQPENLQQLIAQQQQQQHLLKRNILKLLTHLKQQQRYLGLQTGILE